MAGADIGVVLNASEIIKRCLAAFEFQRQADAFIILLEHAFRGEPVSRIGLYDGHIVALAEYRDGLIAGV